MSVFGSIFDIKFKQIYLQPNELILKIKTMNGNKIYLKYEKGTKTFVDIKNFIFDHIKYSCNNLCNPSCYTFKFNNILLTEIITKDSEPIENSKESSQLLDTLASNEIVLQLVFNHDNIEHVLTGVSNNTLNTLNTLTSEQQELLKKKFNKDAKAEITIKTLTDKTVIFNCDPSNTYIHELKLAIYEQEKIPVDQQRLIYKGKQLEDEYTIGYCCTDFDKILMHLVLRLRGGMFNEVSGRNGAYEPLTDLYYDLNETASNKTTTNKTTTNKTASNKITTIDATQTDATQTDTDKQIINMLNAKGKAKAKTNSKSVNRVGAGISTRSIIEVKDDIVISSDMSC